MKLFLNLAGSIIDVISAIAYRFSENHKFTRDLTKSTGLKVLMIALLEAPILLIP